MSKINQINVIDESDWSQLVEETYQRPYCLQQQNDRYNNGDREYLNVPSTDIDRLNEDDYKDSIPEVVNGEEQGVKFAVWLSRDPNQLITDTTYGSTEESRKSSTRGWWERNFYPPLWAVADDLHAKGLLPAGSYEIDISW